MTYDAIEFQFQVHNDATVIEAAYLCPRGLPWGATLEVTPALADIAPGQAVIFSCRLTLDNAVIRPGCTNDQGFSLTAWRVADDADQPWGTCFYFVRPRIRTSIEIIKCEWYEKRLLVYGRLSLNTDQAVALVDQLPLQIRVRLEVEDGTSVASDWVTAAVQPSGIFTFQGEGPAASSEARLRIQAWFDRTDLLASSRSDLAECVHVLTPVVN